MCRARGNLHQRGHPRTKGPKLPRIGSLVSEQARQSAAFVSMLLSSLLGALLAPAPGAATPAPHGPSATIRFASAAANPATPAGIAVASQEAEEDGTGAGDPPALAASLGDLPSLRHRVTDLQPFEPRIGLARSRWHGFSARAPPNA